MRKLDALPILPFAGYETPHGFSHQHPEEMAPWTWQSLFISQYVEQLTQGPNRDLKLYFPHTPHPCLLWKNGLLSHPGHSLYSQLLPIFLEIASVSHLHQ